MGLETGTYVDSLNAAWPLSTDQMRYGAPHLRLLKSTIKATFPTINGAVTPTLVEINQLSGFDKNNINATLFGGSTPGFYRNVANMNAGVLADARVQQSNVTQHQASLVIVGDQINTTVDNITSTFSVSAAHDGHILVLNSASTITVTLPGGVFGVGKSVGFVRRGTGAVTFVAQAGQTIYTPVGLSILLRHGKAVATYSANNTWDLSGNV